MHPRLAWLLLVLLLALGAAWLVTHRRTAAGQARQIQIQVAARRFSELEAQAARHEESTWSSLRGATAADAWWANVVDSVGTSPDRWPALLKLLAPWPELAPLLTSATQAKAGGWQLSRMTVQPLVTRGEPAAPSQSRHQLECLLGRGDERAIIVAEIAAHHPPPPGVDLIAPEWSPTRLDLLDLSRREGRVQFRPWAEFTLTIPTNTLFADPLLYRETANGPELILVSTHQRWRWVRSADVTTRFPGQWQPLAPLTGLPADPALAAALADADGDGRDDLWLAGRAGLWCALSLPSGDFAAPVLRWASPEPLLYPQSLAVADMDHDGDPDAWLTQYKNPYQKGQFPTPYFDANDGLSSYLLSNEGAGRFADATETAGLSPKRHRRTYSASWLDLNGDGAVDLVNVSDFAGLDVYLGNGHGQFRDVTAALGDTRHGFGMAHAVIDRNGDGFPDLLMVGMASPWAARLDAAGLGRPDFPNHTVKRAAMTWGNRIFLGGIGGLQAESGVKAKSLAHAGWAWGVAELDVENDGRPDYFFANGHETRASQRDYERQFWLHDIYAAGSTNDPGAELYFRSVAGQRATEGASYGGWQHQALLRDTGTNGFVDSAWLSGTGILADGRNALAADFDGDGRLDLALTTWEGWPRVQQRLVILRNETELIGHWVGFRFVDGAGTKSAVNARVELRTPGGLRRRWLVTGDGYRTQQTAQVHFGLGSATQVTGATVIWGDGSRTELATPSVDQWYGIPSR